MIAYYASWQWYDRAQHAKPSNLDHSKVTRYNFAFFQTTTTGEIFGTDSWADAIVLFGDFNWAAAPGEGTQYCSWDTPTDPPACAAHNYETGLIYQSKQAGVEVYPSIGGWTLSDPFPAMAANEAARNKFAQQCVELIKSYDFDGIDIDWEYPGYAPHSGTPADKENYTLFLRAIRDALDALEAETGKFYGLTAALPCGPDNIANIEVEYVKDLLTEFNLMTYDFHGSWEDKTGINSPLYDPADADLSVDGCVRNWMAAGAPRSKLNLGLPFYGRSYLGSGITGKDQPFAGGADALTWSDDEGTPQYFNIAKKINGFTSVRDEETMTQIAYDSNGYLSYDDERAICDKAEYAMNENLNGFIIWEISGDVMDDFSTPLLDAANNRLNNPDVTCEGGSAGPKVPTSFPTEPNYSGFWYPEAGTCVESGGSLPSWIDADDISESKEECCDLHFPSTNGCVENDRPNNDEGDDTPANKPTAKPTKMPLNSNLPDDALYYPDYGNDGTKAECLHGGTIPSWMNRNMLKTSSYDCCTTYFPYQKEECDQGTDRYPYYPDFQTNTCISSRNHPDWMAGDYLQKNQWLCCETFFSHDSDLLLGCQNNS
jgi:chitinase